MWVKCTETVNYIGSDKPAVEQGKIYNVIETQTDPVRTTTEGMQIPLAKGDWYRFVETDQALHWGGRFEILAEDSPEVQEHVNKFLFGNFCLNE